MFSGLSLLSPVFFSLLWLIIYKAKVPSGGDAWGFGFLIMIMIGASMGGIVGFICALISLMRNERKWGLGVLGIVINAPLLLFSGAFMSEYLKVM